MIENGFIQVREQRLEALWYGPMPHEAPTLIFLHEGLGCVSLWRDFPQRLAAATGCGTLVYSRLGYGGSSEIPYPFPVNFMHTEGLELLPEVIQEAGIKKAVLIGHSDGGSIGIIYAGGTLAAPLIGLITEAAHVFCEDITVRSIEQALQLFQEGDLRQKLMRYHGSNTDCAFLGWNGAWLNPDFKNWNIESYLPGIKVPMLAIQGCDDIYGTPLQVESIRRLAGKGADVAMIPDCGHSPHRDQEEITFNTMKRFILNLLRK
ncbi:MAG: alpha/beta hydrolase [Pseudomonadota bacterium]